MIKIDNQRVEDLIQHFGTKGMKWGVVKTKDNINSKDRVIKKGTEIQNISGKKLTGKRHMYGAYTTTDKDSYVTVMNFMYGKDVYKNTFKVKKDIKVPSDKKLVEEFTKIAKKNPNLVADDMSKAYNHLHRFRNKSAKHFSKKLSKIPDDYSKKGEKVTAEYITLMVSDGATKSRAQFFGSLVKQGYDAMSDNNDRQGKNGAQDPLIIFNTTKNLSKKKTVKLDEVTLEAYYQKVSWDDNFQKQTKDLREIQQSELNLIDDILKHHGTKGMKWGVRKSEISAKREAKAGRLDAKASGYKKEIASLGKQSVEGKYQQRKQNSKIKSLSKKEIQAIKDSTAVRDGKMTRREKQVVVGAAIVATVAAYTIGAKVQSGEMNALIMKGQAYLAKQDGPSFKKNSDFAKEFTDPDLLHKTVANGINKPGSIGGKVNCRRCTFTYEMRRRGYDVVATKTTTGSGQNGAALYNVLNKDSKKVKGLGLLKLEKEILTKISDSDKYGPKRATPYTDYLTKSTFKDSKFNGKVAITKGGDMGKNIFERLSQQPDNARGELGVDWTGGGKHSVAWEIVKGKPIIIDTQTGTLFKDVASFKKYGDNIKEAGFTRLDNVDIDEDFMRRWSKNA